MLSETRFINLGPLEQLNNSLRELLNKVKLKSQKNPETIMIIIIAFHQSLYRKCQIKISKKQE